MDAAAIELHPVIGQNSPADTMLASMSRVRFVAPSGMMSSPGATASEFTIHLLSAGVISIVRTFSAFSRLEK